MQLVTVQRVRAILIALSKVAEAFCMLWWMSISLNSSTERTLTLKSAVWQEKSVDGACGIGATDVKARVGCRFVP